MSTPPEQYICQIELTRQGDGVYQADATIVLPDREVSPLDAPVSVSLDFAGLLALSDSPDEYGQKLSAALFLAPLQAALAAAQAYAAGAGGALGLRIALDPTDDALHAIRWELLREPGTADLLATSERFIFARALRAKHLDGTGHQERPELRALVAVANVTRDGLPPIDVAAYVKLLKLGLGPKGIAAQKLSLLDGRAGRPRATRQNLDAALGDAPHIVCLVCHGGAIQEPDDNGEMREVPCLWLEQPDNSPYRPVRGGELISAITRRERRPLLVLLLSCQSGGTDYGALSAIGLRLVRAGIPAVLALHGQVPQALVKELVPALLRELALDGRVDRALAAARRQLRDGASAWMPRLWLSVRNGRLWGAPEAGPAHPPEQSPLHALRGPALPGRAPLPLQSHLPLRQEDRFFGRGDDLLAVAHRLAAAHTQSAIVPTAIIHGISGIGKTQLMIEFAHRYGQFFPGGVFWVTCGNAVVIEENLAACARAGLVPDEQRARLSQAELARRTQELWEQPVSRLLLLDGCEYPHVLRELRPLRGGCFVLVTSRRQTWDLDSGIALYQLPELSREASVQLLQDYRKSLPEQDALAIAEAIGYLPYALQLAGKHLKRYTTLTPGKYLQELRARASAHASMNPPPGGGSGGRADVPLENLFEQSYRELLKADPQSRLALALIERAAVHAPSQRISRRSLLQSVATLGLGDAAAMSDEERTIRHEEALNSLADIGLITFVDAGGEGAGDLSMHPLLADYVQRRGDSRSALIAVTQTLAQRGTELLVTQGSEEFRALLPHIMHVLLRKVELADGQEALLYTLLAAYYRQIGQPEQAISSSNRALDLEEARLAATASQAITAFRDAAWLALEQEKFGDAYAHFEKARGYARTLLRPDDALGLYLEHDLAFYFDALNDLEEAGQLLDEAGTHPLSAALAVTDSLETAGFLHRRGRLLLRLGRFPPAQADLARAAELRERLLGSHSQQLASTLHHLAIVENNLDAADRARAHFERALAIRRDGLGRLHRDTVDSVNALGVFLVQQGDLQGARALVRAELDHVLAQPAADPAIARQYQESLSAIDERLAAPGRPEPVPTAERPA